MRDIKKIIIHCSANNWANQTASDIRIYHVDVLGWIDIGYNYVISRLNGLEIARPIHLIPAHTKGENKDSIGICLCGDKKFTEKQMLILENLLFNLLHIFDLSVNDIYPHNHFNKGKTCPNFSLKKIKMILKNKMEV